jgi:heme-degrading monooxygenase HmoA
MVVFTSVRTADDTEGYGETARLMVELASGRPGFLGVDSVRGPDGFGITVAYWEDEAAVAAWREDARHAMARRTGRERWYEEFVVHVGRVERSYGFHRDP